MICDRDTASQLKAYNYDICIIEMLFFFLLFVGNVSDIWHAFPPEDKRCKYVFFDMKCGCSHRLSKCTN